MSGVFRRLANRSNSDQLKAALSKCTDVLTHASLRRSVSASCYALLHLLVDEATRLMLSGHERGALRDFSMKQTAVEFTRQRISAKLSSGFDGRPVQWPLIDVASAFVQLQEACHDADYNRAFASPSARRSISST